MGMYKYTDYLANYGRIMQFNKNKTEPFHRWYPFVEGYSKEFIQSIVKEMGERKIVCLEPFSGSGTTALELQNNGIECFSFEVNPLMYLVARVKLENSYVVESVNEWLEFIVRYRETIETIDLKSDFKTLYQSDDKEKWNYNTEVAKAVQKLYYAIKSIDNEIYCELFTVALASILLDVSNLYRNGKCLSYKKDWKERELTETEVFEKFDQKVRNELVIDIQKHLHYSKINNKRKLFNIDSRIGIDEKIADDSIDLVITSPPYLNSRDYTDTYMLELKTLGFAQNNEDIRHLREQTLRSHVQIKWEDMTSIDNRYLKNTLNDLEIASKETEIWNKSIIDMIRLYFVDMKIIFKTIYKKLKKGGKVYFNVSNSAYFNVLVNTLEICASIAEEEGYIVKEIRKARNLKTSPQQKEAIGSLLEGVIILQK
jgi:DNA modification methylase